MKCIFCKCDSSDSKSAEHIIPESLGNKCQVLSRGIVCDSCNNYFAHKIEKPVLEMPYFKSLRARAMIESKKGKVPPFTGVTQNGDIIEVSFPQEGHGTIQVICNNLTAFKTLQSDRRLYLPMIYEPPIDNQLLSKFICKIAIEAFAQRLSEVENWQPDFVENESLDGIRYFVRYGRHHSSWPYLVRRIDGESQIEYDKAQNIMMEKMSEYDFLIPDVPTIEGGDRSVKNLYFIMAIMGVEYSVNLTNGGIERYINWLKDNQNKSILQMHKSQFHSHL